MQPGPASKPAARRGATDDADRRRASQSSTQPSRRRKAPRVGKSFTSRNPLADRRDRPGRSSRRCSGRRSTPTSLPIIGGGTHVHGATSPRSANLRADDEVRIAGVKVGKVDDVSLDGQRHGQGHLHGQERASSATRARSTSRSRRCSARSTSRSTRSGRQTQKPGTHDPAAAARRRRSTCTRPSPQLTDTVDDDQHRRPGARRSTRWPTTSPDTPASVKPVAHRAVPAVDTRSPRATAQLRTLLAARERRHRRARRPRHADLQQLLSDGNLLLDELNARRDAIHSLLINTTTLSLQLEGLVTDNQKTIGPLLDKLNQVLDAAAAATRTASTAGWRCSAPFYRVFNNVDRQRPLVRQLHPEPQRRRALRRAPLATGGWLTDGEVRVSQSRGNLRGSSVVVVVARRSSPAASTSCSAARRRRRSPAQFASGRRRLPGHAGQDPRRRRSARSTRVQAGRRHVHGHDGVRQQVPSCRPTPVAVIVRELARQRPLHPAGAGRTQAGAVTRRRRDASTEPHRLAGRARRHLRRARTSCRSRSGRRVRTRHGALSDLVKVGAANLQGQRRGARQQHHQAVARRRRPWPTVATTCSAPCATCSSSRRRSPTATRRSGTFNEQLAQVAGDLAERAHRPRRRAAQPRHRARPGRRLRQDERGQVPHRHRRARGRSPTSWSSRRRR